MTHARRNPRNYLAAALVAVLMACAPAASVDNRSDLDRAVATYVSGDYAGAVERLEKVVAGATDDETRREAYTYLGRAHIALGQTEDAIAAFTLGVHYGDQGPCVEYLEVLKRYQEGSPEGLHILPTISRAELAGAAVRVLGDGKKIDPGGPTPLAIAERNGWLAATADGSDHGDDPVTEAALYIFVARVLAQSGLEGRADDVLPGGYRAAVKENRAVSGAETIAVLERVRVLKEKNGR
ncbi:MAG TPA: tetratricopeptide repeat protein [Candidatus Krumholzibacteria bacterium]|nr:tetratricopeptide repeat protein [Candidatus Krumholzibacteria bacterium]